MKITTISFPMEDKSVYLSKKKRGFGEGYLNGYGGKAQEGESPEIAAVRELEEEGGITADSEKLEKAAVIDFFEEEIHLFECHVFFVRAWSGEFKESKEMAYPELYPVENIPYEKMWKSDLTWLPLIFSGKKIKAIARYKKGMKEMESFEYSPL